MELVLVVRDAVVIAGRSMVFGGVGGRPVEGVRGVTISEGIVSSRGLRNIAGCVVAVVPHGSMIVDQGAEFDIWGRGLGDAANSLIWRVGT